MGVTITPKVGTLQVKNNSTASYLDIMFRKQLIHSAHKLTTRIYLKQFWPTQRTPAISPFQSGVLNDRFFEKGLFLSQTSNRHLSNDICLIINFRGKKIAAPQCQQAKSIGFPFPASNFVEVENPSQGKLSVTLLPAIWNAMGNASQQVEAL